MKKEIPIMFCFDNNYVIPAAVAFYSLLKNASKDYYYILYVLHSDITEDHQFKLKETIAKYKEFSKIEFINMDNKYEDLWRDTGTKGHFSKELIYKLLAPSIFPQYEKLIVSDVDVVFPGDISGSYTNLNVNDDIYLSGVKPVGKIMKYMNVYKEKFTDEEIEKLGVFAAGYFVFNLKKLRKDNMEKKFIECFKNEAYRINQPEQDVLNLCCYPKTSALPLRYLACSYMWDLYQTEDDFIDDYCYSKEELKDAMANTIQLHYATSIKPWKNVDCTKSEEWFKYIVETEFLREYLVNLPSKIVVPSKNSRDDRAKLALKTAIIRSARYIKKNPLFFLNYKFYKLFIYIIKRKIRKFNNAKNGLLIIDDSFPSKESPFRYEEYISYSRYFIGPQVLLMKKFYKSDEERREVKKIAKEFMESNPKLVSSIDLEYPSEIKNKLAVVAFLNNIYDNLEYIEEQKIPFIFTLYPGGGFALNDPISDEKLKKVLSSCCFRKVITTQKITRDYLISNNFCEEGKIEYIYGVVTPQKMFEDKNSTKKYFGYGKETLDICFVAHKYIEKGIDKGYDLFIDSAKSLAKKYSNIHFHVVGDFTKEDIDISSIENKITFYGIKGTGWLTAFYDDKDIILSPNRPFILSPGSFDGFPTGSCTEAMLNRVALFCSDELNLNDKFADGKDLVIIKPNKSNIVKKIDYYYNNPGELKKICNNGRLVIKKYYSYRKQMVPRIKIINKVLREMK